MKQCGHSVMSLHTTHSSAAVHFLPCSHTRWPSTTSMTQHGSGRPRTSATRQNTPRNFARHLPRISIEALKQAHKQGTARLPALTSLAFDLVVVMVSRVALDVHTIALSHVTAGCDRGMGRSRVRVAMLVLDARHGPDIIRRAAAGPEQHSALGVSAPYRAPCSATQASRSMRAKGA